MCMKQSGHILYCLCLFLATALAHPAAAANRCAEQATACFDKNGALTPFTIKLATETSAGSVNLSLSITHQLKDNNDGNWEIRTKLSTFVYALYGSITDKSEFLMAPGQEIPLPLNFSRSARVYGIFPVTATSFKQTFNWEANGKKGTVKSRYRGDWYNYFINSNTTSQALIPLRLRLDLIEQGPNLGTVVYQATSKKNADDDFMFQFVTEQTLDTPLGTARTVVYELLKGRHKVKPTSSNSVEELDQIEKLLNKISYLQKVNQTEESDTELAQARQALNELLLVDQTSIVTISEQEAKSTAGGKPGSKDGSLVDRASDIDESNARLFFWLSKDHAYLPVKLIAVIDGNSWSRGVISSIEVANTKPTAL